MSIDRATAAFQRLVDALNRARDPALLRAAVTDDVRLDRCEPGERGAAPVAESFTGIAEVERWFARTPAGVRFSLAGPAGADGGSWAIEYAYDADAFHHGGIWVARLATDGRIVALSHHPFALAGVPTSPSHTHPG